MDETVFRTTIEQAGAGDRRAINALHSNYNQMLTRFMRAKTPGHSEELVRQTWLVVGRRLLRFVGGERRFRNLLFSTALEQANRYSQNRRGQLPGWADNRRMSDPGMDRDPVGDDPVTDAAIASLLDGLHPLQADILLLRVVGGLTVTETASLLRTDPRRVREMEVGSLNQIAHRLSDLTRVQPSDLSGPA